MKAATFHRSLATFAFAVLFLFAAPAWAQYGAPSWLHWDIGAGVTPLVGGTTNEFTTGWNVTGGVGYNFNPRFGAVLQVMYDGLGVRQAVVNEFNVPGANAHIWGVTLNPVVRFRTDRRIGFYTIGGGGYYERKINLTQPVLVQSFIFDPFFGFITPVVFEANQVIGTVTKVGWGGNLGAGITYRLGDSRAKFFVEARYHYIGTQPVSTQIFPVTFGIRW